MTFTSEARRRHLANRDALSTPQATLSSERGRSDLGRVGTTEAENLYGLIPYINMKVNPNNIEFRQPKRYTRQDTMRGTVFHHFTNNKRQNNDLLTVSFQGNTGNISAYGDTTENKERYFDRLQVWHNLYQLTREEMYMSDGAPNAFYILYSSPLFPTGITFTGFFSHVLQFSENAKKPNSRDYMMEFIVQDTDPSLDTISQVVLSGSGVVDAARP
jgi:hypothetical protein